MIGLTIARLAYETGAGLIGAGSIAVLAAMGSMALLFLALAVLRNPIFRVAAVLIFVGPAILAGYALVHGLALEAVPSVVWRQVFSIAGGVLIGASALARLTGMADSLPK